jgi:hypothetical protein
VILLRLLVCIGCFSAALYLYLDKHNQITKLRYALPTLEDELMVVREQNLALLYEIEQFESPINLMRLLEGPEYSHLHHPELASTVWIEDGSP